jgi:hypothetical protein
MASMYIKTFIFIFINLFCSNALSKNSKKISKFTSFTINFIKLECELQPILGSLG